MLTGTSVYHPPFKSQQVIFLWEERQERWSSHGKYEERRILETGYKHEMGIKSYFKITRLTSDVLARRERGKMVIV